jgi:hypothetical protein
MLMTKLQPVGLTQTALAEAMGVQRKHINELEDDGSDGAHSRARVRQQPRFLAEPAAARGSVGGDEQPPGA